MFIKRRTKKQNKKYNVNFGFVPLRKKFATESMLKSRSLFTDFTSLAKRAIMLFLYTIIHTN